VAKIRKIDRTPANGRRNYFLVDASFLANNYIEPALAPAGRERLRIEACQEWWQEIHHQLDAGTARVYVPDICIAESFKVLAKKYYTQHWFQTPAAFSGARRRLARDITMPAKLLKAQRRTVRFHDVSTSRDIIIAVDRFYELFMKSDLTVSLPDLIIVSTAKYLIDFFDVPKSLLHIVTLDRNLRAGTKKIPELPNAYDPTEAPDAVAKVFRDAPPA